MPLNKSNPKNYAHLAYKVCSHVQSQPHYRWYERDFLLIEAILFVIFRQSTQSCTYQNEDFALYFGSNLCIFTFSTYGAPWQQFETAKDNFGVLGNHEFLDSQKLK